VIVDSSALVAIVDAEPDELLYRQALREARPRARIAAPTLLEAAIVADSRNLTRRFDAVTRAAELDVVAFDAEMTLIARAAYRDYGRGSGHAAQLNFGDCFSYALAAITGEPLLYKGDDFSHTDVRSALT
jgi:ribonuclease VapC